MSILSLVWIGEASVSLCGYANPPQQFGAMCGGLEVHPYQKNDHQFGVLLRLTSVMVPPPSLGGCYSFVALCRCHLDSMLLTYTVKCATPSPTLIEFLVIGELLRDERRSVRDPRWATLA